jgi:fructokinase
LSVDHPAWRLEAEYLAYAVVNLILTLSPERVILGGGVMSQEQLFPLIRQRVIAILNDYIKSERLLGQIEQYIVSPGLGTYSGVLGAVALAMNAVESS